MTILRENAGLQGFPISEIKSSVAVLTSWKDIAQYVGKGVRTVQRWERELGLPVRRPKHAKKSTVLAVPTEIDDWVRAQEFLGGEVDATAAERSSLIHLIRELKAENSDLRRQLQTARAKPA